MDNELALRIYAKTYDDKAYIQMCKEVARLVSKCRGISTAEARLTGEYDYIVDQINGVAQEHCGYHSGHSRGWSLVTTIFGFIHTSSYDIEYTEVERVFDALDDYLGTFGHAAFYHEEEQ